MAKANNKQRYINTRFWNDSYVSELDPIEKLLFIYCLTNGHTNISGIYEIPLKVLAVETGIDVSMLAKILPRLKDKVRYVNGRMVIKNFIKHQETDSPNVRVGILNCLKELDLDFLKTIVKQGYYLLPKHYADTLCIPYIEGRDYSNSNSNSNSIVVNDTPFSLKEEIQKLEDSTRRDLNIIALYLEHRKPDLQTKEQYLVALRRHLKPAKELKPFTDSQILKAVDYAKKEYKDIWTIETLSKILTK